MIGTLEPLGAAAWFATNSRASMRTSIQKNVDFTAAVARDDDRTNSQLRREEAVAMGNLALMRDVGPGTAEHPHHLLLEYRRVGVQRAMNGVPADEPPKLLVGMSVLRRAMRLED